MKTEAEEYEQLGLKCGIEIHQQLSGKKLFCNCPAELCEKEPEFSITRKLRASAGELGQLDIAARQEMQKDKTFIYEGYKESCCLVELDESPPNNLNPEALQTTLQVAKMLKARPVDCVQVMRKTVIDGSNTSGFQRTALIAMNGILETSAGKISIPTIVLEEDAARIIKEDPETATYRLDRLGIPLIEIGTGPDIKTPEQAKEVAEKLGMLLRSTGRAKRGIGTIRQDINVSIKEGNRIEIKGAQELKQIPQLVELEILRQKKLAEITKELKKRKAKKQTPAIVDVTELLRHSGSKIIQKALEKKGVALAIKLQGFAGLLGKELQPNKRFGTELSDRAKVVAGVEGLFHSDELPAYGITEHEVMHIKRMLGCAEQDAFVLIADAREKAQKALESVTERANNAIDGVPCEVRKANPDGTTTYERPMPGAARMYPETDVKPIPITKKLLSEIRIPELIEEKAQRYEKLGLAKDIALFAAKSEKSQLFDEFTRKFTELKPAYIAEVLFGAEKAVKRQYGIDISPSDNDFEELFDNLAKEKISKESVLEILKEKRPVNEVIGKYYLMPDAELEKELQKIARENKGLPFNALIGKAMSALRGKASGQKIAEKLKKITGN